MTPPTKPPGALEPCPFCASLNVDAEGWISVNAEGADRKTGPACDDCGASTPTVEIWNTRALPAEAGVGGIVVTGEMQDAFDNALPRREDARHPNDRDKPLYNALSDGDIFTKAFLAALALLPPPAIRESVRESKALDLLTAFAYAACEALDNSEAMDHPDNTENGVNEKGCFIFEPWYGDLCAKLEALADLPDDQPGYIMGPIAKVQWAMRSPSAERLGTDPDHPDCATDRECELYDALMGLASHVKSRFPGSRLWKQGGMLLEPVVSKALRLTHPDTSTSGNDTIFRDDDGPRDPPRDEGAAS